MPKDLIQVMISSTTRDLAEHRAKAINAVLHLHMFPLGMEHSLNAASDTPVEASLGLVDQADIFVGIIGRRYGCIPPGANVSITHMEYNRAVKKGIPRLIFLMDSAHPGSPEEDDYPEQLRTLKNELQATHVTGFFTSADDLTTKISQSLARFRPEKEEPKENDQFSDKLQERFARFNKAINKLTANQYRVIDIFRAYPRKAINGCAGSGKTLLAIEKAIRLRSSHYRVLLLSHNPHLARFIAEMTVGTGVIALDFVTWVREINQSNFNAQYSWTHYEEPSQSELDNAFSFFADHPEERYNAIIVDEGQDFEDDWWVVVEAALVDLKTSPFWIFYDSNQKLREATATKLPIPEPHDYLPNNCRNAGEVFELVRRFHDQAPEVDLDLAHEGIIRKSIFHPGEEKDLVIKAVTAALEVVPIDKLALLTTEMPPEETSIFNGFAFHRLFKRSWQHVITEDLNELRNRVYDCPDAPVPHFGLNGVPAKDDIVRVQEFAEHIIHHGRLYSKTQEALRESEEHWKSGLKWLIEFDQLRFKKNYAPRERLMCYLHGTWANEIPAPELLTIAAGPAPSRRGRIALYSVSTFKGLEVEGAVLFVRSLRRDLKPQLYVGTSRPRFFLHVLLDPETDARYSQQFGRYEPFPFTEFPS